MRDVSSTDLIAAARALGGPSLAGGAGELMESLLTRLADALESTATNLADAEQAASELRPDPILVEGSWIPVKEMPQILGNFMRSSAEYASEWKKAVVALAAVTVPTENADIYATRCLLCYGTGRTRIVNPKRCPACKGEGFRLPVPVEKPPVHDHGPAEGRGLDCNESVVDGFVRGACMSTAEQTGSFSQLPHMAAWYWEQLLWHAVAFKGGPHSRACGIKRHDHGAECHNNCPTCEGSSNETKGAS